MDTEIKPAVIGVGLSGGRYADALAQLGHEIILFDTAPGRAKRKQDELENRGNRVTVANSLEQAIESSTCVFVCTPDHLHLAPVEAVARARKPLFLEKPIAPTLNEANQIDQIVRENDIPAILGLIYRLTPVFQEARKVITEDDDQIVAVQCDYRRGDMIASIASQPWRYHQHFLRGDGIHAFDLAQNIVAEPIETVSGHIDAGEPDPIPGYQHPTRYQCRLVFPSATATIDLDATAGMKDIWPPNSDTIVNECYLKIRGQKNTAIAHNKRSGLVIIDNATGRQEYRPIGDKNRQTVPVSAALAINYFTGRTNTPSPLPTLSEAMQVTMALHLADQSALGDNSPLPLLK